MTTGIVYHKDYLSYEQHPLHPERRERLAYTDDQLSEEGIRDRPEIVRLSPRMASEDEVLAVHERRYLEFLREANITGGYIDSDTIIPPGIEGRVENAFAMVRPPGHHAGRYSGAGFCYLNNMAIMVQAVKKAGIKKVLILDWDAHHGNGTQEIFYEDPSVLFTSIHQSPFYPGTGSIYETGSGTGAGYSINMPVPWGSSDSVYEYLIQEVIIPAAEEFRPDFIAISAGQDNHFTDPLTALALSARGYAEMMKSARNLAERLCDGRLVAVLEGGYGVESALPYVNHHRRPCRDGHIKHQGTFLLSASAQRETQPQCPH